MGHTWLTHCGDADSSRNRFVPQDDFPREPPHSAARVGSHRVPVDGSHQAKPLVSALVEELAHQADGAKPLKPPPLEHPSSKGAVFKGPAAPLYRYLRSPCQTQHQKSIEPHQKGRRKQFPPYTSRLLDRLAPCCINPWETTLRKAIENCKQQFPAGRGWTGMTGACCPSWGRWDPSQGHRAPASAQVQADHSTAAGCV